MNLQGVADHFKMTKPSKNATDLSIDSVFVRAHGVDTIYLCDTPLRRLQGVFFRKGFSGCHAVLLRRCSCVHSVGLRIWLSAVFMDREDRVLSIKVLPPNRTRCQPGAHSVLEVTTHSPLLEYIRVGDKLFFDRPESVLEKQPTSLKSRCNSQKFDRFRYTTRKQEVGASMVEFLLIAPVLCFLGFGIVQLGLVYHAQNVLSYATFEAARVGAVKNANSGAMKEALAQRLAPIFGGDGSTAAVNRSLLLSKNAVSDLTRTQLHIINPTVAAFEDFGVPDSSTGETVIPNAHLQHREKVIGARSGVTVQDANLLKIEVTHGYGLTLPWFNINLPGTEFALKQLFARANPKYAHFYNRGMVPIKAVATVRMQSRAKQSDILLAAAEAEQVQQTLSSLGQSALVFDTDSSGSDQAGTTYHPELVSETGSPQDATECLGAHGLPANLLIEPLTAELSTQCVYEGDEQVDFAAIDPSLHSDNLGKETTTSNIIGDASTEKNHSQVSNSRLQGC
jgi:uncharacterized membrane protein (UPF0127 family)